MRPALWNDEKHERFTEEGTWAEQTITEYVRDAVEATPDRPALVDKRTRYTYAELDAEVMRVGRGLREMGVRSGDVIAHQIPNRAEGAILHLAALRVGAVVNPIVTIYRQSEVSYMLEKLDTTVYVAPMEHREFAHGEMVAALADNLPALEQVVLLDADDTEGGLPDGDGTMFQDWTDVVAAGQNVDEPIDPDEELGPNELSLVQFTSGTTGRPKGVMHTENTLLASQRGQAETLGLRSDDVIFTPSPIGHLTGIQHGYRYAFMLGTTCVLQERWDPETALEWIESESCTYMAGATPFVRDLARHDDLDAYDTSSLRLIMTAGAPCPKEVIRQAHASFDTLTVYRGWGQTENTLPTVNPPEASAEKLETTDGKPYGGMEARVREPGEIENALAGEEGELQVRGPFLFLGYFEAPERTASSFTDDGWFKTGDKATIDEAGHITIKGRIKDIIIRGGENIPIREIEEYLHEHPKVHDGAIVAMPDERLQERGCAYVIPENPDEPLTFDAMVEFLQEKGIATQKLPERVEIVDELPMTASGKVQRYKLREDIADKLGMEPITR